MPLERRERGVDVFCLDVGQGDGSLILPPVGEGGAVVFDCRDAEVLLRTLDQYEVTHVEALIISHLDQDHIAGVVHFLANFDGSITTIYLPVDRDVADEAPNAAKARKVIDAARDGEEDGRWRLVDAKADPRPVLAASDGHWAVHVIAPRYTDIDLGPARTGDWEADTNRHSAVVRVCVGERCVLIGGDAPLETWSRLPESERSAQVFRIPHHGGALGHGGAGPDAWDVERLYAEVGAETAIVSVGTRNDERWNHPRPEWIHPITGGACRMLCTQVTRRCQPDIRQDVPARRHREDVIARRTMVEPPWRHYRDEAATRPRRRHEVPCAGTVVVRVTAEGIDVLPLSESHAETAYRWEHPLCLPWPVTDPADDRLLDALDAFE